MDANQIILRREDLPRGCEMIVGNKTRLRMNGTEIEKETGSLARFFLAVLQKGEGKPFCWRGAETVEMLCMMNGSFGESVYEDRNGNIWIADREADLMARHDSEDPELSWYRGVPYRRD